MGAVDEDEGDDGQVVQRFDSDAVVLLPRQQLRARERWDRYDGSSCARERVGIGITAAAARERDGIGMTGRQPLRTRCRRSERERMTTGERHGMGERESV